jgi:DNA repair protein RecO (recombination protein O)
VICRTQAIVLRVAPYSETSRVVSWLTADHGRVATLAKGALRPKSAFLGAIDLFQTCELLFYMRPRETLRIARECTPFRRRDGFRTDWRAAAAASYFADLAGRVCPPEAPHPEVFDLLETALDEAEARGAAPPLVFWFELKLLGALGLAPRLNACLSCGGALLPSPGPLRLETGRGGLLCPACGDRPREPGTAVTPDIPAILAAWQRSPTPQAARSTRLAPRQQAALDGFLHAFLAHHLETDPASRRIALRLLAA